MEKTLQKIANLLILNLQNINSSDVLNGKTGGAIFFYKYAQYTSKRTYSDYADNLLDDLFSVFKKSITLSYFDNIAAIGYGVNYMIQKHFIEVEDDLDEVFQTIDEKMLQNMKKIFVADSLTELSLCSSVFYALSRLETGGKTAKTLALIAKLIDELQNFYSEEENTKKQIKPAFSNSVIYFLNEIDAKQIETEKVNELRKTVLLFILNSFETATYNYADRVILQNILLPRKTDTDLVKKIFTHLNQLNLVPENVDTVFKILPEYLLFPVAIYPDLSELSIENYVNERMNDFSVSDLATFINIGLIMLEFYNK